MFAKLKKKHDSFNLLDFNNTILILSLFLLGISLIITSHIFLIILIYLLIFELNSHITNKYLNFLTDILAIILLGFVLIYLLNLSFLTFDIKGKLMIVIKGLLFLDYFFIVCHSIQNKKLKIIKGKKRAKKYTFKELRDSKIGEFKVKNLKIITSYLEKNNILEDSDYYKVIYDNFENKARNDLEEYVWMNYLRFYKNKKYNKLMFDKINFVFILIHVIIFLLAIIVR